MKMAKRILAVILAVMMAFSVFSISGSAALNKTTYFAPVAADRGTIEYGLNVYKIVGGTATKVDNMSTLSPGDVIEVRVCFGTDFYVTMLNTQVFYNRNHFTPYLNGAKYTEVPTENFPNYFKTFPQECPKDPDTGLSYFDTILPIANGGITAIVNKSASLQGQYYPLSMREGYEAGTATARSAVVAPYTDYDFVSASFTSGATSAAAGQLIKVPYGEYYAFQLVVNDGANTGDDTTSIFFPIAQRTKTSGQTCNRLYAGTSKINTWSASGVSTLGQGLDLSKAEFECKIGENTPVHTHQYTSSITKQATCSEAGVRTYTCSCGDTYTDTIQATGIHTYDSGVQTQAPTCVAEGITTYTCTQCHTASYTSPIAPTGVHSYNAGVVTEEPTCVDDGVKTFTCGVCGGTRTEPVDATGVHTYGSWRVVKPATTTSTGTEERVCSVCTNKETRTIEKLPVTEATYTINVYTMDTTGAYGEPETQSDTEEIGSTVSVSAADYEATGFYVDTTASTLSAVVTETGATLNVYVARKSVTYTFVADGSTFESQSYYYGATVIAPLGTPTKTGYTFKKWTLNGATFTGAVAGTENVTVEAQFEKDIDPSAAATEADYTALAAALKKIPDPVNLYYYTDEAIMWVCEALGGDFTTAAEFLADATANGYRFLGLKTSVNVQAATAEITRLATASSTDSKTLNYIDNSGAAPQMPNRDESKANIGVKIVPTAVNGKAVTSTGSVNIQAGDQVTFSTYLTTDYYLMSLYMPIVYDSTKFMVCDSEGTAYDQDNLYEAYDDVIDTSVLTKKVKAQYDVEVESTESLEVQYPAPFRTAEYMGQNKIILASITTKAGRTSVPMMFSGADSLLFTFTLEAKADIVCDGSVTTTVGCPNDWYAKTVSQWQDSYKMQGIRAAGLLADGKTPAINGSSASASFFNFDVWSQFGQTYTAGMAQVTFGSSHEHNYTSAVTKEPTCVDKGVRTYTCECGDSYTEDIDPTGIHTPDAGTVTTQPTCVAAGTKTFKCTVCKTVTGTEPVAATGVHTPDAGTVTTEPTCAAAGTKTFKCTVCKTVTGTEPVAATGNHTPDAGTVTKAPTCVATGTKTFKCTVCKTVTSTETIPATGVHTPDAGVITKQPTCVATGTKTFSCSVCGTVTGTETVAATGVHTPDAGTVTKAPTCVATGTKTFKCTVCQTVTSTETVQATGVHTPNAGVVTVQPTCNVAGIKTFTCTVCGTQTGTQPVPATGLHTPDLGTVTKQPTCGATGTKTFKCTVCQAVTGTEVIPATGDHAPDAGTVTKEPTCSATGTKVIKCTVCKNTLSTETIPATGVHTKDAGTVTKAATCGADGEKVYKCTVCKTVMETEVLKATGNHVSDAGVVTKEATDTEDGVKTFTCTVCGKVLKTETIPATGTKKLVLKDKDGKVITNGAVTAVYTGKGKVAVEIKSNVAGTKFESSKPKVLTVDAKTGTVKFVSLSAFRGKVAEIKATTPDGQTATVKVTVKYKWWQWLLWIILGHFWY